jgi:hypothetical protein
MKAYMDAFTKLPIGKKAQAHINVAEVRIKVNDVCLKVRAFESDNEMTSDRLEEANVIVTYKGKEKSIPIKKLIDIL